MIEQNIKLTRGDTGLYVVDLIDMNDNRVDFGKNIEMYFTVKNNFKSTPVMFQKSIGNGITYSQEDEMYHLRVDPIDTNDFSYGVYVYDIEVKKNNDRFTVAKGKFILDYEVTFLENEV